MNRALVGFCLILLAAQLGCASTNHVQRVKSAVIGTWEYVKPKGAIRKHLGPVGSAIRPYTSPHPDLLVFHDDGTFRATYSPGELATLRNMIREPELTNPVSGEYDVVVDFAGVSWIKMRPGPPERRLSITANRLLLHNLGTSWAIERYKRR